MTGRRGGRRHTLPADQQTLDRHLVPVRITPPPRGCGRGLPPNQRALDTFFRPAAGAPPQPSTPSPPVTAPPVTAPPVTAPPPLPPPIIPRTPEVQTVPGNYSINDDFPEFADLNDQELVNFTDDIVKRYQKQTPGEANEQVVQQDVLQDATPPAALTPHTVNFHQFDSEKLCTWVYPINYPTRNYQLDMIQKGLFQNTLIALPTGLGKTFIAAVIMFNYWRWFPESKVVFLAPTRPLVAQQIEACFKICSLPQSDTIEITDEIPFPERTEHWRTKRVFFMTPQTIQNDLATCICPADKIVCLVVDEAHKAIGKYALSEVVHLIAKSEPYDGPPLPRRATSSTATPKAKKVDTKALERRINALNGQIKKAYENRKKLFVEDTKSKLKKGWHKKERSVKLTPTQEAENEEIYTKINTMKEKRSQHNQLINRLKPEMQQCKRELYLYKNKDDTKPETANKTHIDDSTRGYLGKAEATSIDWSLVKKKEVFRDRQRAGDYDRDRCVHPRAL